MAINKNYAIWNNKGGVGKSTITFHIASRYAELHPDEDVLVVDMCPQANSSMMLLGGGNVGESHVLDLCKEQVPKTVVGYISNVLASQQGVNFQNTLDFVIKVNDYNTIMPSNLFLLCGDGNLEPISSAIVSYANMQPISPHQQPWVWVHHILKEFINSFAADRADKEKHISVFIDTNPAFGVYTELAVLAAEKLICPVNADDSSRTAAAAMSILLHGSNPPHPIYGAFTFAVKAAQYGLAIPKFHLIIGNRFTQYSGAAAAYMAMSDATANQMYQIFSQHQDYFSISSCSINNVDDFRNAYSIYLRDFNTAGVVASHTGSLLSCMKGGTYTVYGRDVTLDSRRISDCQSAIDEVIHRL